MNAPQPKPISILVAALGGEGGGLMTNWLVAAADSLGFPVQSTSIPGVAQRTGATTYYIEILPTPWRELGERRPVLALVPGVGDIDMLVASELLEAGRAVAGGFVTPGRTLAIASTHRMYSVQEKIAMGDGRYDESRLLRAIREHAERRILFDMDALARREGTLVNTVMLGAVAGSGRLPIPPEAFEQAIRADGRGAESSLRGFRAGLEAAKKAGAGDAVEPAAGARDAGRRFASAGLDAIGREIAAAPEAARDVMAEGARRLAAYQDAAYARLYLDRLGPIREADARAGAGGRLLGETARHLALRMSFEDVIRVAQAKTDPARRRRIAEEKGVRPGDLLSIAEFLKPGIEEVCSLLPPALARPILRWSERRGWLGRVYWGLEVKSTTISGFLRLWLLAKLKPWRPRSHRYREEQAAIEAWLASIAEAARLSGGLAVEVAQCAGLIKGYGDTHRRGAANYRSIETRVIRPALAGHIPPHRAADAVASARVAALADPEGAGLAACLADIEAKSPVPAE